MKIRGEIRFCHFSIEFKEINKNPSLRYLHRWRDISFNARCCFDINITQDFRDTASIEEKV